MLSTMLSTLHIIYTDIDSSFCPFTFKAIFPSEVRLDQSMVVPVFSVFCYWDWYLLCRELLYYIGDILEWQYHGHTHCTVTSNIILGIKYIRLKSLGKGDARGCHIVQPTAPYKPLDCTGYDLLWLSVNIGNRHKSHRAPGTQAQATRVMLWGDPVPYYLLPNGFNKNIFLRFKLFFSIIRHWHFKNESFH